MNPLSPEALSNVLTLRYYRYRTDEQTLPYKEWTSLWPQAINIDNALSHLDKIIEQKLTGIPKEVTLLFSGGLDSSYLMSKLKGKTHVGTITLAYRNTAPDTLKEALDHFKPDETHTVNVDNVLKDLPKQIRVQRYPLWHLYSYYVMEKAFKLGLPTVTGDGGDEALAGYEFRYKIFLEQSIDTPRKRVEAYLHGHNRDWVPDQRFLFHPNMRFTWLSIRDMLIEYFQNPLPPLRQVFLADYHGKLRWDWVPMYRKWASHFNLKLITPFLETEAMQFGHSLPTNLLFHNNEGKILLRESLKRSGVPANIVRQPKSGFSVGNLDILWRNEGRRIFSSLFFEKPPRVVADKIIRQAWITRFKEQQDVLERDPRYLSKAFQLIALEVWYRMVKGEIRPDETL